jgi:hypothetical protein
MLRVFTNLSWITGSTKDGREPLEELKERERAPTDFPAFLHHYAFLPFFRRNAQSCKKGRGQKRNSRTKKESPHTEFKTNFYSKWLPPRLCLDSTRAHPRTDSVLTTHFPLFPISLSFHGGRETGVFKKGFNFPAKQAI